MEQPGQKLVHIEDVGTAYGSLTYYATAQASCNYFLQQYLSSVLLTISCYPIPHLGK